MADTEKHERDDEDDADGDEKHAGDGDAEGHGGGEGQGNAAAKRVAEALGVDGDDGGEGGDSAAEAKEPEASEPEAAPNRAARRRDEALKRRKKSTATASAESSSLEDDDLPRDRNKRAKELLKQRREQASGGSRPVALLPSEMVDDALSRSANAFSRWFKRNFSTIQWAVLAAVVGGIGFGVWTWRGDKTNIEASTDLAAGVAAERGLVMAEDKRPDDVKEMDPSRVFKTAEERDATALASYKKVIDGHPGTGPALLAKLGEAGVYLEKHDWPNALERYSSVSSSTLAGADPDVKGRALEGLGLAKEGKGDIDGALATFKELESIDAKGFKELGMYHQGRILLKKGEKDQAKDILKKVHDTLHMPSTDGKQLQFLITIVDQTLREIDPALAPIQQSRGPMGGPKGNALSPEELMKLQEKIKQMSEKKEGDHHH